MKDIKTFGAVPSARQMKWHKLETYGFIHFTVNTFTNKEWGYGDESPSIFNPVDFDADQIVSAAAAGGLKGLILTCKHHDGFCLWSSKFTEHSVKNSPWKDGKGDVVREISDSCRKHGLKFGVYLSPWDRNHAEYGTPAYIEYFRNQLNELTTQYGELFEVWFDGANGGDGYYGGAKETRNIDRKTYYDWENTYAIIRKNQPNAVIFSDGGPDVRWVGNEHGVAGDPCWETLTKAGRYPGVGSDSPKVFSEDTMVDAWQSDTQLLNNGDRNGLDWVPAECDVSIRPGWFYHEDQDDKVRTPENLFDLYIRSVGRGCSFLLNLPPTPRGLIHDNDVKSLIGYKKLVNALENSNMVYDAFLSASNTREESNEFSVENITDNNQDTFWATDDDVFSPWVELNFDEEIDFNIIGLREYIPMGQRVDSFSVDILKNNEWKNIGTYESIGARRLVETGMQTTSAIRITFASQVCPAISEIGVYKIMENY
ncbi:MAG: alpha-L-fucosidase [Kiritimatiellae bacterium]|nr:alpha-L-fucosidase [Kiritimatiellia bacterium]